MLNARQVWRFCVVALIACIVALVFVINVAAQTKSVDVALILAVDVSASIDLKEAQTQRDGYAAAIESQEVVEAITGGLIGAVAISYVEWSSVGAERLVADWTVIDGPIAAQSFAAKLRAGKPGQGGQTAIGSVLMFADSHFDQVPVYAERLVLDISGDDVNNQGLHPSVPRDALVARGAVINALVVGAGDYTVGYFREHVIGGPGAFVIRAEGHDQFAAAVRTKIALEIAGMQPARKYAAR